MSNVTQYRTQLLLDEDRYLWLKSEAEAEDKPMAQVVREMMDEKREKRRVAKKRKYSKAYKEILALGGSIREKGGVNDVSENHDKYLGEALYNDLMKNRK